MSEWASGATGRYFLRLPFAHSRFGLSFSSLSPRVSAFARLTIPGKGQRAGGEKGEKDTGGSRGDSEKEGSTPPVDPPRSRPHHKRTVCLEADDQRQFSQRGPKPSARFLGPREIVVGLSFCGPLSASRRLALSPTRGPSSEKTTRALGLEKERTAGATARISNDSSACVREGGVVRRRMNRWGPSGQSRGRKVGLCPALRSAPPVLLSLPISLSVSFCAFEKSGNWQREGQIATLP